MRDIVEGKDLVFDCILHHDQVDNGTLSADRIQFKHFESWLPANLVHRVDKYTARLIVPKARQEDSGRYHCYHGSGAFVCMSSACVARIRMFLILKVEHLIDFVLYLLQPTNHGYRISIACTCTGSK